MNRILVTGGAGFIGSNFIHYWLRHYSKDLIVVLDKLGSEVAVANLKGLEQLPNFVLIQGDIGNPALVSQLFRQYHVNKVINFAAENKTNHTDDSDTFITTNVEGTYNLLKIAKKFWVDDPLHKTPDHHFHQVSIDEVYGTLTTQEVPPTENSAILTNSPYAASKAAADHFVRAFQLTYGLNTTISRSSNNYGPFHFPDKLISLALLKILRGESIPIHNDGLKIKDWIYVIDYCRAIELILKKGTIGECYNVGGQYGEITNLALAHKVFILVNEYFELQPERKQQYPKSFPSKGLSAIHAIQYVTNHPSHDGYYVMNSSKIINQLGFNYRFDLDQGLRETILWYLNHPHWWSSMCTEQQDESTVRDYALTPI